MVNENARKDVEKMRADGLDPTFDDCILLNAVACRCKAVVDKVATRSHFYLPRAAQISPNVVFRQPAIGHEIWLAKVERLTESDIMTRLAVRAYALSRQPSSLPDPDDPRSLRTAVETFAKTCAEFTVEQIDAAIGYVVFGPSPLANEYPIRPPDASGKKRDPDGTDLEDWKMFVAVGVMREAQVFLFGVTQAEIETMTREQVEDLKVATLACHGLELKDGTSDAYEEYFDTRDAIRERLERERAERVAQHPEE